MQISRFIKECKVDYFIIIRESRFIERMFIYFNRLGLVTNLVSPLSIC